VAGTREYGPTARTSAFQADSAGSIPATRSPPSSSGLGRRPLTAVTRVQIPLGVQLPPDSVAVFDLSLS